MQYNDDRIPTPDSFAQMAKAYSNSLKDQGFVFIKLDCEDYNFLIDEVFEILFKLRSSYRFLKGFMASDKFLLLNDKQIDSLRLLFNYTKNRGFQIKANKTKCFLNTIALENRLILKMNELARKSDYYDQLSSLINSRLLLATENYSIEGVFNNLINLSLD